MILLMTDRPSMIVSLDHSYESKNWQGIVTLFHCGLGVIHILSKKRNCLNDRQQENELLHPQGWTLSKAIVHVQLLDNRMYFHRDNSIINPFKTEQKQTKNVLRFTHLGSSFFLFNPFKIQKKHFAFQFRNRQAKNNNFFPSCYKKRRIYKRRRNVLPKKQKKNLTKQNVRMRRIEWTILKQKKCAKIFFLMSSI